MKIGVKLTAILVLVAVAGIIITALISFVVARKGIEKRIGRHLENVATLKKYHLNDFIKERINDIDHIAKDNFYRGVFLGGTKERIRNILKEKLVYEKEFIELFILDLDGQVHVSTDEKQEGKIKSFEKYFIEGKKGPFIQSFYYDLSLQQPSMTISAPIKDDQGSLSGLLAGRANLKRISSIMTERIGLGETGETYLVNRFNYLVTESRFEEGLALKKLISTEGVKDCLKGNNGLRMYNNYRGTPVVGFYEWIPERQACLLAEISQEEAFASINRLRNILIFVSTGIVILVVILGFFFSKTISKPLEKLIRGTEIIGKGDLEHRVDVRTKDEIGKLALAFNDMTERRQIAEGELRKHRNRLEELVEERTVELKKINEELQHEIVEHKRAQETLRQSEERFRQLYDEAPVGYHELDREGRITRVNRTELDMLGYSEQEMLGQPVWEFIVEREMSREAFEAKIAGAMPPGRAFERTYRRKDGTTLTVIIEDRVVRNEAGQITSINSTIQDISERNRLEAQLQQAQKMQAIATLAGGIAHEFNNTLVGITGNIELLQTNLPEDENIDKYAERMKASAHRMAHLTAQLLAYARGGKYQPKNISISDFVEETLPLMKQTIAPSIRIGMDLPHNILNVEADLTQMQMVLSAILNNSAEAIEEKGRIRITTKNEEIDEEFVKTNPDLKLGPYVSLTVEDDGKGMDEETRSRIFDPFFTTKFQGRGLGMAAVYGIVTNHGGWISVDSELGKGTVVRIYLPAVKVEVKEVERPKIEPTKGTGTILVIEDEDVVIDVIVAMLEKLGYHVLLAKTGKEAVKIAKGFDADIDLAILDILLPDLPAKKVYRDIMEARPDLKVIVCSGYAIDGPPQEILDAGAQDFIQKPFSYATLSEKLKEVLEGK